MTRQDPSKDPRDPDGAAEALAKLEAEVDERLPKANLELRGPAARKRSPRKARRLTVRASRRANRPRKA